MPSIRKERRDMKKVNQDPFSSGTAHAMWEERNCDRCVKASRYKGEDVGGEEYTQCRCAIQRDIFTRMCSDEPISQRTIDICRMVDCPNRMEHWPKRKHDKYKNEPKLFDI